MPAAVTRTTRNIRAVHARVSELGIVRGFVSRTFHESVNFRSTVCPSLDRRREAFPCQRTLSQGSVTCSPFPTNISALGNVARGDLPGKPPRITRDKVAFLFLLFIFFTSTSSVHVFVSRLRSGFRGESTRCAWPRFPERLIVTSRIWERFVWNDRGKRRICRNVVLRRGVDKFGGINDRGIRIVEYANT